MVSNFFKAAANFVVLDLRSIKNFFSLCLMRIPFFNFYAVDVNANDLSTHSKFLFQLQSNKNFSFVYAIFVDILQEFKVDEERKKFLFNKKWLTQKCVTRNFFNFAWIIRRRSFRYLTLSKRFEIIFTSAHTLWNPELKRVQFLLKFKAWNLFEII